MIINLLINFLPIFALIVSDTSQAEGRGFDPRFPLRKSGIYEN